MSSSFMPVVVTTGGRARRVRRLLTAVLAAGSLAACAEAPVTGLAGPEVDRPVAGALLLNVSGVQPADAAFQLVLTGVGSASDLTVAPPLQMHVRQRGDAWHVALFGTPANGALLQVRVPDVRDPARYTARVTDVARSDGVLRGGEEMGSYRVSFVRAP